MELSRRFQCRGDTDSLKIKTNLKSFAFSLRKLRQRVTNLRCSRGAQLSEPSCHTAERRQRSYLFAEARNRRSFGIDAQSLLVESRKRAFWRDGHQSGRPHNLPRQSIPCLRIDICLSV